MHTNDNMTEKNDAHFTRHMVEVGALGSGLGFTAGLIGFCGGLIGNSVKALANGAKPSMDMVLHDSAVFASQVGLSYGIMTVIIGSFPAFNTRWKRNLFIAGAFGAMGAVNYGLVELYKNNGITEPSTHSQYKVEEPRAGGAVLSVQNNMPVIAKQEKTLVWGQAPAF